MIDFQKLEADFPLKPGDIFSFTWVDASGAGLMLWKENSILLPSEYSKFSGLKEKYVYVRHSVTMKNDKNSLFLLYILCIDDATVYKCQIWSPDLQKVYSLLT